LKIFIGFCAALLQTRKERKKKTQTPKQQQQQNISSTRHRISVFEDTSSGIAV